MNKSATIRQLQALLHIWLSKYDSRSLVVIKDSCDSLNESYQLGLSNPIWDIFWPLVFNGLVDHIGNGYYALTEPLIVDSGTYKYSINIKPNNEYKETSITGIYVSRNIPVGCSTKVVKADAISILKQIPAIEDVVDSFPKTLQDETNLEYYNRKTKRGIAKIEKDGLTRYFSLPEKLYIRELPSREINPEAFAITYCLSRKVNNEYNGSFCLDTNILKMPTFAMPFTIYRALLLETMKVGSLPEIQGDDYVFKSISSTIYKELNRIFSNSIRYE